MLLTPPASLLFPPGLASHSDRAIPQKRSPFSSLPPLPQPCPNYSCGRSGPCPESLIPSVRLSFLRPQACGLAYNSQSRAATTKRIAQHSLRYVSDLQWQFTSPPPGQPFRPELKSFCCKLLVTLRIRDTADGCKCSAGETATTAGTGAHQRLQTNTKDLEGP
jgi:hypothetical protein